jgi:hypothetical protein
MGYHLRLARSRVTTFILGHVLMSYPRYILNLYYGEKEVFLVQSEKICCVSDKAFRWHEKVLLDYSYLIRRGPTMTPLLESSTNRSLQMLQRMRDSCPLGRERLAAILF